LKEIDRGRGNKFGKKILPYIPAIIGKMQEKSLKFFFQITNTARRGNVENFGVLVC
jgi:hypothetical protein